MEKIKYSYVFSFLNSDFYTVRGSIFLKRLKFCLCIIIYIGVVFDIVGDNEKEIIWNGRNKVEMKWFVLLFGSKEICKIMR